MVGAEVFMMDLLLAFPRTVDMVEAEICVILFLLTLLLELSIIALVDSLAGTLVITEPDLAMVTLFVEKVSKFL